MIKEKINKELKDSMLNGNKTKTATLRLVLSAIKDKEILERTKNSEEEIGDNAILDILTKMVKQRIESSDIFTKNERLDLAKKEDEEGDGDNTEHEEGRDDLHELRLEQLGDLPTTARDAGRVRGAHLQRERSEAGVCV